MIYANTFLGGGGELSCVLFRFDDFTPLASVLSTTVAQSDTVSPQESFSGAGKPPQIRTRCIYRNLIAVGTLFFTAKAFDVAYN